MSIERSSSPQKRLERFAAPWRNRLAPRDLSLALASSLARLIRTAQVLVRHLTNNAIHASVMTSATTPPMTQSVQPHGAVFLLLPCWSLELAASTSPTTVA